MKTIRRVDTNISFWEIGSDGPTVVFLHGLAGSSRELRPTAEALAKDFRLVLIDQRGHGRSTRRPGSLSREDFALDVIEVIQRCSPAEPVTLVGESMGGHTAFLVAAARPDLVARE